MKKGVLTMVSVAVGLFFNFSLNAQTYEWTTTAGGTGQDGASCVAVDGNGNVYTTGYFQGTVDFDPSAGVDFHTSSGGPDVYVQKVDAAGNFLWAKTFGGSFDDYGYAITVDGNGNIYTSGKFTGTVDFDPSGGIDNRTSNGGFDAFIQKMDAAGNFLWVKTFGGTSNDLGNAITVDGNGNIYTTGNFIGTVDFDPSASIDNHTSSGLFDVFVQKMDAAGNFLWAKTFGGTITDNGNFITLDGSGNIYVTGSFQGTADFDPSSGVDNHTSSGGDDIFVQKMDASGNFLWAQSFGGTANDRGNAIAVDGNNNIYTTGYFAGTADLDPSAATDNHTSNGLFDAFVQKMDASGNFSWSKAFGATFFDEGLSIKVDAFGYVYTAGRFYGTVDFDSSAGIANYTSNGVFDIFIQKLDASGNFIWTQTFGGTDNDEALSITVDANGSIYTAGQFKGTVDFDLSTAMDNQTSVGGYDIFVHKLGQCLPTFGTDVQTACDTFTWIDGNTYTASNNTATWTLTNATGCDSLITLNLTMQYATSGTDVVTGCDSYTWIDGNTYNTANNTATWTLTNAAGCDSVVTLNLTMQNSTSGTDIVTACDAFTWIDGNTYTTSTNTATFTITNAVGCDSVVTLDLTMKYSSVVIDTVTACDSYTWIDGNTYTASTNTATWILTNSVGCDSVIILDLTINTIDVSTSFVGLSGTIITVNDTSASAYQWLDCDNNNSIIAGETNPTFTATANGNYAVVITENGCVDTSACVAVTTVGTIENTFTDILQVYPNPTAGDFSIDLGAFYESVQVSITDISGKLIDSKTINHSQLLHLNITEPAGLYIISIQADDKKAIIQLLKK